MSSRKRQQLGLTIVELVIVMCILAVLSSIAISRMGDFTRRARISEVIMAAGFCKSMVSESYPTLDFTPAAGGWGCNEGQMTNATKYAGVVHTSPEGIIRITIQNLDNAVNGQHVFLVPAKADGITPMTTPNDLGNGVRSWICGSDFSIVRNALPANCRADTLTYANYDYN